MRPSQDSDARCPSRRTIGRVFEVHRAREEACGERRTGCDQGTGSQSCSRNRVVGGFGKFAAIAIRSHVRSTIPSNARRCRSSRDPKVESLALLESGSTDTSREVMRQKKAKTLNAPSPDLANMGYSWPVPKKSQFQLIQAR